jgi:dihydroorotate dehydrogenase electron transfer subunit
MGPPATRGTVVLEQARVVAHTAHAGNQYILRVHAPRAAARAEPGSFAHITCAASVPMRRPLSIMRADPARGELEFLYKPVGPGLRKLAGRAPGSEISVLAPIGRGFSPQVDRPRWLAIGGGVGIPPMIFLGERAAARAGLSPVVLMGSEVPFPFEVAPSAHALRGVPAEASHAVALLDLWQVPSRLASQAELPGCYRGYVTDLARAHLRALSTQELRETQVFGCGPAAMLRATAVLARDFHLPCQLALEEYMACGIGGCAGCTVLLETADGPAMKRVCVDGPVFDAREVFPDAALSRS